MRRFACLLAAAAVLLTAADWAQFRNDSRSAAEGRPPLKWSVEEGDWQNIAWRADLPGRGPSSPIVVGNRVLVTASGGISQERMYVLCFDKATGKERWRREFWATGRTSTHTTSANAAPTPASDGQRVFAFFSSNDLVCLDLEGNLQWYRGLARDYPKAGNDIGMSSSPVVVDGTVVVQVESQGDSFAAGLDAASGQTRWRIARSPDANWTSPIAAKLGAEQRPVVFLQSPDGITAHQAASGEQLWKYEAEFETISSPVFADNRLYGASKGLTALQIDGSATPKVLWSSNPLAPASSSPVLYRGRIYTTNRAGVLACADAATGKAAWDEKMRLSGRFWATHAAANGHLYCFNSEGKAMVVELGERAGKIVFECDFGEDFLGSPAISGDAIFVRTDGHLWKIAQTK